MTRLAALLLLLLMPAVAGAQLMAWAGPQPGDTIDPIMTQPAVIAINNASNNGTVDYTPTVTQGTNLTFELVSGTLPGTVAFDTATGQISGSVGSSYGSVTLQVRAKTTAFTSVASTPTEFYDIWPRLHWYTSTANISDSSGPQYLSTAGRKYTLTGNLTTPGSCLAITAASVLLDGAGFTASYDQATAISITNPSFETVDAVEGTRAESWDWTNAPASTTRFAGTFFSNEIYAGDYSIEFGDATDSGYIETEGTFSLESGVPYSVSGMFMYGPKSASVSETANPGVVGYVQVINTADSSVVAQATRSTTNTRGIQLVVSSTFTPGSALTCKLRVGITGHASATKPYYIDDVKVQRDKCFGVMVSPKSWNPTVTPDLTTYGEGTNSTITNLTISQGSDGATASHGAYVYATANVAISDVTATVAGANSSCIMGNDSTAQTTYVLSNTLTSNVATISSRDAFNGAVVLGIYGAICHNTIANGPHSGIVGGNVNGLQTFACYNTIALKTKYTNAFAIHTSTSGLAYGNTINCGTGEYMARGIGAASGTISSHTQIFNNTVSVQALTNNQEYGGVQSGGTYGIQIDTGTYVDVFNNTVNALGSNQAICLRLTSTSGVVTIHDNTLVADTDTTGQGAAPFSFLYGDGTDITIENNAITTNNGIAFDVTTFVDLTLTACDITVVTPVSDTYVFSTEFSSEADPHSAITFSGTTYADGTSQTYVESATIRLVPRFGGGASTGLTLTFE